MRVLRVIILLSTTFLLTVTVLSYSLHLLIMCLLLAQLIDFL